MSSDDKYWEDNLTNMVNDFNNFMDLKNSNKKQGSKQNLPPPVPARPNYSSNRLFNNYFPSNFNPSSYSGGYSPFYNPYDYNSNGLHSISRFGYNRYPYSSNYGSPLENDFIRLMDESCGPAFQSLESIVQSVASLSTMIESTYFAVYSSFRAVLAVAHHISSLKDHFTDITNNATIFKTLRNLIRQILQFFGLIETQTIETIEKVWSNVNNSNNGENFNVFLTSDGIYNSFLKSGQPKSSLPLLLFFAVIIGGPWLIWTLFSNINKTRCEVNNRWSTGEDDHYIATALYQFQSESPRELSFRENQKIIIAPKELQPRVRGWILGSVDNKTGLIPINYIKINQFISSKKKIF